MDSTTFDKRHVEDTLTSFFDRCQTVQMAGGIPYCDVVNQTAGPPPDWVFDWITQYYIPPHLILDRP